MKYLSKSIKNSYSFRMRIPKHLRVFFSKNEIKRSLETYDYDIACLKANFIYNEFKHIIKVSKMSIISTQQIQELVNKFIRETLEQDKLDRAYKKYGIEGESCYDPLEYFDYMIRESKEYLACNNYTFVEENAKILLKDIGINFDTSEPTHKLFQQTLMRGQIAIFEEALNRAKGTYSSKFDIPSNSAQPIQSNSNIGYTYADAYKEFKIYYTDQKNSQATKNDTFRVLDRLMILVGDNTPIDTTKLTDLIKIKQKIEGLPNSNLSEYKNLSFEEMLNLTNVPSQSKISDSRAKDYIKHIKKFFAFCYQNRIITFDPSGDLNIAVEGGKKDPFSNGEATELLKIFDSLELHIKLLLYIYPYTGMRREELFNSTIEEENGIKYFNITDGKNTYAKRRIPLHSKLLSLGLDNESFSAAKSQISYVTLAKLFNKKIKPHVTSSSKKTLHSWRHTVATQLQHEGIPDNLIQNILGHSARDTLNRVYAREKTNLLILNEAINKISY